MYCKAILRLNNLTNRFAKVSEYQSKALYVFSAYLELCKPRVVALMLVTSLVGMLLASPQGVSIQLLILATIGIGLTASAGAAINHVIDRHIDSVMSRTKHRPMPSGTLSPRKAAIFGIALAIIGLGILLLTVNLLTAILTFLTFIGYAIVYTVFLKHATPQNIVIGGAAGAMPPLLGWVAVTGHVSIDSVILFLIIFFWTPPHFWALAIHRYKEYAQAKIPMLPVTHGIEFTKTNILVYTIILFVISLLPALTGMVGISYFIGAVILNSGFVYWALRLKYRPRRRDAMKTFRYSIVYLLLMFLLLLMSHYILITNHV